MKVLNKQRSIYDFRVVCDETINTPEVIDRNEFVVDVNIKPVVLTIAFPLELVDKSKEISVEEFVKQFNETIEEYEKEHEQ